MDFLGNARIPDSLVNACSDWLTLRCHDADQSDPNQRLRALWSPSGAGGGGVAGKLYNLIFVK